jgi:adenylate cyclase
MAEAASGRVWPLQAWRVRALVVGACLALIVTVASALPIFWSWQETADLSFLFQLRGARPSPEDVVIVPIDGRATRRLFLPSADADFERCTDVRLDQAPPEYRNPNPPDVLTRWPRCLHARALDALALGEPDAVVMDISFRPRSDPSGIYAEQDRTLAAAMRRFGKVVLARKIKSEDKAYERAQPIAAEIEAAALAVAPFLLLGDHLQRADKFCTFIEDDGWSGPCMPAVAHQAAALASYAKLRDLLLGGDAKHSDLLPVRAEALLSAGALQAPVSLIRHLAMSDRKTGAHIRGFFALGEQEGKAAPQLRLRGLSEIYLGAATRYFNFYGPPGWFKTLRYEALVAGNGLPPIAPGSLRGKTVFIGFAEYGRPEPIEHFTTPFTTRDSVMSGVELAATAFANLQDRSSVEPVPLWTRALIVLAVGLACTLLCALLPRKLALPLCIALLAGYFAAALGAFQYYALWLPLLMPLGVAAPLAIGAGLTFEHNQLKRERDRFAGERDHIEGERQRVEGERAHMERVIDELLPKGVKQKVLDKRLHLAELLESGPGACLSTDLKDSTKFAEIHDADEVRRTLNLYFEVLDAVLEEHDVLSTDYTGDGLMAVWRDKVADATVRAKVCAAALRLAFAAEQFRLSRKDGSFVTRIGVHYGDLQVGMIGGSSHKGYRPVGDVPNTATALQQFNKHLGTKVLASSGVVAGLPDFLVRELGHFVLPKKEQALHIYELVALRGSASPTEVNTCKLFAEGLAAYREGRRRQAREAFFKLREADGPSAYYYQLCANGEYYGGGPVLVPGSGVV